MRNKRFPLSRPLAPTSQALFAELRNQILETLEDGEELEEEVNRSISDFKTPSNFRNCE